MERREDLGLARAVVSPTFWLSSIRINFLGSSQTLIRGMTLIKPVHLSGPLCPCL